MADDYNWFIEQVKERTGIDLNLYKETQMKRRLIALREKRNYQDFRSYFTAMTSDDTLQNEFLERMTINVSEFFRNRKRWDVLDETIIPQLLKEKKRLKVWSAACSTGEEPYTLAMILQKHLPLKDVSILATDIDRAILQQAKVGYYTERSLKEIPVELKERFFTKDRAGYYVSNELKQAVTFKQHNLLADRFERDCDLIVCRNVLIYFTEEAKRELYHKFSEALRPGGVLFVGSTEQIFEASKYGLETNETFFYRKV
ncbi:CheR family methyltransferase [Halalkalibacterium halodurans]|jgi:chemotaxis protein methyltransferase CheR|uniref:protein-glutamate O-methyltransferase n=1 Tax=Halalkalibacterium halodurans TaxID=86665 RepID=A0A0M0KLS0_ALKHA|nr:protein-glutamate O-methyltransferase CheR [Halalkalibacterium halodurans]MED4123858.1 protein-glutamate O-methyltransferase CheR [Halalkalibacterium halodurans]MED4163016.1 protein-glutamate O-methyltransferase CheR [Halalkalibacterium halodurans]TPE70578.1 protein-glutamate O-methyltransferase CheR [Halalkalibacterium halodurans]